jgi:hypothetical protein
VGEDADDRARRIADEESPDAPRLVAARYPMTIGGLNVLPSGVKG